jgi:hypothetical protein
MDDEIVVVRTFGTEVEAQLAQAALAAEGIPSIVLPDNAGGMLPMLQVLFPVRLAVRRDDAEAALTVLDAPPVPDAEAETGRASWEDERE